MDDSYSNPGYPRRQSTKFIEDYGATQTNLHGSFPHINDVWIDGQKVCIDPDNILSWTTEKIYEKYIEDDGKGETHIYDGFIVTQFKFKHIVNWMQQIRVHDRIRNNNCFYADYRVRVYEKPDWDENSEWGLISDDVIDGLKGDKLDENGDEIFEEMVHKNFIEEPTDNGLKILMQRKTNSWEKK